MNTYRVTIGTLANIVQDTMIVRAYDCAEAERKTLKKLVLHGERNLQVTRIEMLEGTFIE